MHPRQQLLRVYSCRVLGSLSAEQMKILQQGVELEDGPAKFAQIQLQGGSGLNQWYQVAITEGKKREVRRLFESQGLTVNRLIRIQFGPFQLPRELHKGRWVELKTTEVREKINQLEYKEA